MGVQLRSDGRPDAGLGRAVRRVVQCEQFFVGGNGGFDESDDRGNGYSGFDDDPWLFTVKLDVEPDLAHIPFIAVFLFAAIRRARSPELARGAGPLKRAF